MDLHGKTMDIKAINQEYDKWKQLFDKIQEKGYRINKTIYKDMQQMPYGYITFDWENKDCLFTDADVLSKDELIYPESILNKSNNLINLI